jgi:hypothetical protein
MQSVVNARKAGASISKLSKNFGYSRDTIRAALAQPESSQFTQATVSRLERIVTKGLARYETALDTGKVNANSIPVHVGIALDKRTDLMGEVANRPPEQIGPTISTVLEELRALVGLPVQVDVQVNTPDPAKAIDVESVARGPES